MRSTDPFTDLDAYLELPRVQAMWLSPDGDRLVVSVATPDRHRTREVTRLWEVDPAGTRPARRLTNSGHGESEVAFAPDGDLLFVSSRPGPDEDARAEPALWRQPAAGGDARLLARPPGGVRGVTVSASGTVVFGSNLLPSARDVNTDRNGREPAMRQESPRSCTRSSRSGTGITTSARTGPGCSPPSCRAPTSSPTCGT